MNEQCGHWMVLDESEIGSDAQDQQATEAVDESKIFFFWGNLRSHRTILGDLSTKVQKDPVASL